VRECLGRTVRYGHVILASLLVLIAVAACGSSSSSVSRSSSSGSATSASSSGSPKATGVQMAAARAAIAPYVGHPSAFPVTEPLGGKLPPNTRFVYLQCSTPVCALLGQVLSPAVRAIGASLSVINSGGTASSSQSAASSALALKPAAVLIPAVTPSLFGTSLKRLVAAGIKVDSVGVINGQSYGITYGIGGLSDIQNSGRLMADWVVVHKGGRANVVFYTTPELDFSRYMEQAFAQQLAKLCPSCQVRSVPISVETFGSSAPQTIANDLQSHPSTNTAVFSTEEAATGLPAALKTAGLSVTTVGFAPTPGNLQDIKTGGLTAGLGLDLPVQEWTQVDAAARLVLGKPIPAAEAHVPLEFLSQKDITFNPAKGWTGYPNFASMFVKLWH
jgi:ribose transport system substrate-binding protein